MKEDKNKPIIATMINSIALALTSYGVLQVTGSNNYYGYISIIFGVALEYCKYLGMKKKLW